MSLRALTGSMFLICLIAAPAYTLSQTPAATSTEDAAPQIVVEGRRDSYRRDLDEVRAITIRHDDQIARFETQLCVSVIGLPASYGAAVEAGIGELANRVGLKIDNKACRPNFMVMVTAEPVRAIAELRKRRPGLFDTLNLSESERLSRSKGPAWSWYSVDHRRKDGAPVEKISEISYDNRASEPTARHSYMVSNAPMALLSSPVRSELTMSFVVLDIGAIDGLTVKQIADFAGMMGLSMIDYDRASTLRGASILHLFQPELGVNRAAEATTFDIRYLKGLYSGDPGDTYEQRSARMVSFMQRDGR